MVTILAALYRVLQGGQEICRGWGDVGLGVVRHHQGLKALLRQHAVHLKGILHAATKVLLKIQLFGGEGGEKRT